MKRDKTTRKPMIVNSGTHAEGRAKERVSERVSVCARERKNDRTLLSRREIERVTNLW